MDQERDFAQSELQRWTRFEESDGWFKLQFAGYDTGFECECCKRARYELFPTSPNHTDLWVATFISASITFCYADGSAPVFNDVPLPADPKDVGYVPTCPAKPWSMYHAYGRTMDEAILALYRGVVDGTAYCCDRMNAVKDED